MRKLYRLAPPILLLLASFNLSHFAKAQTAAYADPSIGSFDITTQTDLPVNANTLASNTVYKLKLIILNQDQVGAIPNGTCQVKIGLGSKLKLNPGFNLATAPYSSYFTWSLTVQSGQEIIIGTIHTPLPADFLGELAFNVRAKTTNTLGSSTVTGNFLIVNENPSYNFSDLNPNNNTASMFYTISIQEIPLPVTITALSAINKNCGINVRWDVAQELNFSHYEVEMSKDGINYAKVATVNAQNLSTYSVNVPVTDAIKAPTVFVRLKNVDIDGSFKYSKVVTVAGTCSGNNSGTIYSYPNPVRRDIGFITIVNRESAFNGNYNLILSDMAGKTYSIQTMTLNNVVSFRYETSAAHASGQYILRMQKIGGTEINVIPFEKL